MEVYMNVHMNVASHIKEDSIMNLECMVSNY